MTIAGPSKSISVTAHAIWIAQDHCRKYEHIVGANTLRLLLAAARTLWFIGTSTQQADVSLQRCDHGTVRRWPPVNFDVVWACREGCKRPVFFHTSVVTALAENQPGLMPHNPLRLRHETNDQ